MRISFSSLTLSLALGAGFLLPAVAKADPIITNGDFTYGSYTFPGYNTVINGWTDTGGTGATGFDTAGFFNNGSLPNGDSTVGFIQGDGSLSTEMTGLTSGQTYDLTFLYNARSTDGGCCDATPTFTVSADGSVILLPTAVTAVGGSNPFLSESIIFVADGSSESLSFDSTTNGDGTLLLSDVSVAATPEPDSLILLGTGLLGVCGIARRRFVK